MPASMVCKKSILKSQKKAKFVQFICFSIQIKTRKLSALLNGSSKKQQREDRFLFFSK
jgi:hypothetical protein